MVDMIRLDHFRGFEAYWEVPSTETTAVNGRWVKGPGSGLFLAARMNSAGDAGWELAVAVSSGGA
jgi:4-alpha-glucanotransferase